MGTNQVQRRDAARVGWAGQAGQLAWSVRSLRAGPGSLPESSFCTRASSPAVVWHVIPGYWSLWSLSVKRHEKALTLASPSHFTDKDTEAEGGTYLPLVAHLESLPGPPDDGTAGLWKPGRHLKEALLSRLCRYRAHSLLSLPEPVLNRPAIETLGLLCLH